MNKTLKNTLYSIVIVLLFSFAPAFLFAFVPVPLWAGIALLSFGFLSALVCAIVNLVKEKRYVKSLIDTPMSDWQTHFDKRREEIQSGIREASDKLSRLLRKVVAYNVFLIIAFFCISCGVIALMRASVTFDEDFTIAEFCFTAIVICAFLYLFYMPVVSTLFRVQPKNGPRFWQTPLPEHDYPLLYGVAERSAKAVGYKGRFYLMPCDDNGVSVSEEGGTIYIDLPPALLPLLTEEELYSVLVHEFAHALHADTRISRKCGNLNFRYGERQGFEKIALLFFSYAGSLIDRETDLLLTYSGIEREKSADEEVKKHADGQTFINATAKAYLFDEVFREAIKEFAYDAYGSEQPPEDDYERLTAYFSKHAHEIYPHALEVMMRRLPARNDSHPTFRMRAETFGVTAPDPFLVSDGEFHEEELRFTRACGRELQSSLIPHWKYMREENYIRIKAIIEKYDTEGENAAESTKLLALDAFWHTDFEKALSAAGKLLQDDETCNAAKLVKGSILCTRDDEQGLPLLLESIRANINLADMFDLYGETVLRTGKQELLDELRKLQTTLGQELVDGLKSRMKEGAANVKNLAPCKKDARYETLVSSIRDFADSGLKDVYLCADEANGRRRVYAFLPLPADETAQTAVRNLQQYFAMLWRKNEEYYVNIRKPNDRYLRRIKKKAEKII